MHTKEEAKKLLLESVKPGQLLLFVVKRSRTGFNQRVKVYMVSSKVKTVRPNTLPDINQPIDQQLLCLTHNIAVLMGLAKNNKQLTDAFNNGFKTDEDLGSFAHYLAATLWPSNFTPDMKFQVSYINM